MAKTRSMNKNLNHEDDDNASSSSRKRFKTCDDGSPAPWSNLDHDVLFLVIMQLGVVDFLSFSRVCKSWRSLALSNKTNFISSRPPMFIWIDHCPMNINYCSLRDFERRRFEPILPPSDCVTCYGLTCGYLILFGNKRHNFWLVNPITNHKLHFPDHPLYVGVIRERFRGILVFSPSISEWVFVMLYRRISFHVAGKRRWNHVTSTVPIVDIHFFKGKIYTLHKDCSLRELRFHPKLKHKWTLHEINNFTKPKLFRPMLISSADKLYVLDFWNPQMFMELDFGKMEWVKPEKTLGEYAFFYSYSDRFGAIKPESWSGPWTQYKSCDTGKNRLYRYSYEGMWYFPPDCLNVNLLDE